ncbi:Mitochondrial carrier protein [Hondaea fermentalgiana]|uniref:Mitochondrial carrier protein n=1 Tax=Hondaea fermentalgiana TaxID=2315210 RepID=A0A2R5GD05_9STRA|nr:Mitochondrial carrier protein [Hondaea fermentalgiana]|eukprot:GBG25664.1 Mitochondrial carrier protein [Hondaea fermentalgiana]
MEEEALVQMAGAGLGAAASTLTFYPLELVKVRLQAQVVRRDDDTGDRAAETGERGQPVAYGNAVDVVRHLVEAEGVMGLFRGVQPVLLRSVVTDALYFFVSFNVSRRLQKLLGRQLSTLEAIASGFVSACITQLVAHPIDTVTTRIMTDHSETKTSALKHLQSAVNEGGLSSLWKGYRASMLLSLNPALQFTLFDRAKEFLQRRWNQEALTARQLFLLGMVTKAFTLTIIYPLIRAKIFMQAANRGKSGKDQISVGHAFSEILDHEGVLGLYKGLREQIGKSTLSTALLLTTKEEIAEVARKLITSS